MALWKDIVNRDSETESTPATATASPAPSPIRPQAVDASAPRRELKESVLAAGLTFEGKIEGSGHVRISGRFHGDIKVNGTLTIDAGASLAGSVRAGTVIISGELDGNIEGADRVELQPTAVVTGDITAGSLSAAAGAKMRGRAEFGWGDGGSGGGNKTRP